MLYFIIYSFNFDLGPLIVYKTNIKLIVKSCLLAFFFTSCEKEAVVDSSPIDQKEEFTALLSDYFYDLNNESVDAKFLHYRKAGGGYSNTVSDPDNIDVTKDTLNFITYNDFRLKVPESEIQNYNQYVLFDETSGGTCQESSNTCIDIDYKKSQGEHYVIDGSSSPVLDNDGSEDPLNNNWVGFQTTAPGCVSPENDGIDNDGDNLIDSNDNDEKGSPYKCEDKIQSGVYDVFSGQHISVDKLIWDVQNSIYDVKLKTTFGHLTDPDQEPPYQTADSTFGQYEYASIEVNLDTLGYTYDSLTYMTSINDFISPDTGIFYLDTLEFVKTSFLYTSEDIEVFKEFTFDDMIAFSSDSMVFRRTTDCNQNGQNDEAEIMNYDYNNLNGMTDILYESIDDVDYCGAETFDQYGEGKGWKDDDKNDICYEFNDLGNGKYDEAELYYDINLSGAHDTTGVFGAEPFEDLNCNGKYDVAEIMNYDYNSDGDMKDVLVESDDAQDYCGSESNGPDGDLDDICYEFTDVGNGQWDGEEYFITEGQFVGSQVIGIAGPTSLLFDHSGPTPTEVLEIDEFTVIEDRDGNTYKVLDNITIVDSIYKYIPKVDSVITIFSNDVITHFAADAEDNDPSNDRDLEYVITKTRNSYASGLGYDIDEYAYNIFNTGDSHVKELINPSFFLPYGFYETPQAIADSFWFDICRDTLDIFLYAPDGYISTTDGDNFSPDTLIINKDKDCDGDGLYDNVGAGDYHVEIDYDVEKIDTVMVKMRKILTDENGLCLGGTLHDDIAPLIVSNPTDCYKKSSDGGIAGRALDTLITDCFKVTKTMTMTYIGSGVEYGERVTMWLAKDIGIVKNHLDIRWSEPYWVDEEQWSPYSRWELVERRQSSSGNSRSLLDKLSGKRKVTYEDFESIIEFNNEPFKRVRTAGLHKVGN